MNARRGKTTKHSLAASGPERRSVYVRVGKPSLDTVIAAATLVVFAPLMLAVAVVSRAKLGRPVLFRQTRPGLGGRPFTLLKFRTMTDERDKNGDLLPDERRLTRWGRLLRATSLDELPQLVNVLRGDMSLVGPRPLLVEYLDRYSPEQARRHDVKPGITGWAQVHGRNNVSWEKKLAMDVWYVDHQSAWLDLRILVRTVLPVFSGVGVCKSGHATTDFFNGEQAADKP